MYRSNLRSRGVRLRTTLFELVAVVAEVTSSGAETLAVLRHWLGNRMSYAPGAGAKIDEEEEASCSPSFV